MEYPSLGGPETGHAAEDTSMARARARLREARSATGSAARKRPRKLTLRAGDQEIEVIDIWRDGFAILRDGPRPQRGFVDLFDGNRHLCHALAYPTRDDHDRRIFAFKTSQPGSAEQPRDY